MWRVIRAFMRAEVLDLVKKQFTEANIRKLVERALKKKVGTKKMKQKLAVGLRENLTAAGFDVSAGYAQELVGDVLDDLVERVM